MNRPKSDNITWNQATIGREQREEQLGQRGCVLWLTGLSGSGKSTVARAVETALLKRGRLAYVLDGDNLRHGLNADLGFSAEDRDENIRRVGEVAGLFADAGAITLVSFISPYRAARERARQAAPEGRFLEIYLDVDLAECERRDPKGLYERVRAGEIKNFTGVDAPYELPTEPALVLRTAELSVSESVAAILDLLVEQGFFPADAGTQRGRSV